MPAILFDSSVYIAALRAAKDKILSLRRSFEGTVWLSSVVLAELYMGASSRDQAVIEDIEKDFDQVNRILTPNVNDWISAGRILARFAQKYDYDMVGRGRMTNDALIAMSAARKGIVIITANADDFALLGEFRQFHWRLWSSRID